MSTPAVLNRRVSEGENSELHFINCSFILGCIEYSLCKGMHEYKASI